MILSNIDCLTVKDGNNFKGGAQDWYTSTWQRKSGCGPTAASNQMIYLSCTNEKFRNLFSGEVNKKNVLSFMEEIWKYITPTAFGVHKTSIFEKGFLKFAKEKNVQLNSHSIHSKNPNSIRTEIYDFIKEGINNSSPVAFLNLSAGETKNLDSWHWVLIVGYDERDNNFYVTIFDEGIEKEIDLSLWAKTSKLGGGFVWFACD